MNMPFCACIPNFVMCSIPFMCCMYCSFVPCDVCLGKCHVQCSLPCMFAANFAVCSMPCFLLSILFAAVAFMAVFSASYLHQCFTIFSSSHHIYMSLMFQWRSVISLSSLYHTRDFVSHVSLCVCSFVLYLPLLRCRYCHL